MPEEGTCVTKKETNMIFWDDYYLWQGSNPQKSQLSESSANNKMVSNYRKVNTVIVYNN